ncbi:undecaprenol kinase [Methanocaldococcus villosus KIN24-T80]|uniref:Undecaprenyl-diphosphatase n=1 Tax=Methanocaldococcus villosus KIN24-T80 TaxID=1069083 RepID=N6VRJ1_9EURY|nr:undecaprenyl-diphosphate phosphatase [Methanocaldococcus villosus]ENN96500.1 undecaprenol kinase [Methanocaldococcus villosus KIN24-T80]
MSILEAIVLSFVEGLTEFLPISSTAHLIVVSYFLHLPQNSININFEITIQLAAILAVIFLYNKKLYYDLEIWKKVVISFIPIAILGFLFHKQIYKLFNIYIVALAFIIGGLAFIIIEKFYKVECKINSLEKVDYKRALIIGLFQCLALIPGTSRSGATIIGGMLLKLDRKTATEFSFLSAIPVMLSATIFSLYKNIDKIGNSDITVLIIGFFMSFITAIFSVRWLLNYVRTHNFIPFGIYRIIFGLFLLILYSTALQ